MQKSLAVLVGKKTPIIAEYLSKHFKEIEFEITGSYDELKTYLQQRAPSLAIICTSDINNGFIELVKNNLYNTSFLFIIPEFTRKLYNLSALIPFFDFAIGDPPESEVIFRVQKLYSMRKKINEFNSIIADTKASRYNMVYEVSRIAEVKSGLDGNHIIRVAQYTSIVARELRLSVSQINDLFKASVSHDIGKIVVPDFILGKRGKLTPQEKELVKQHTIAGAEIIEKLFSAEHHAETDSVTIYAREIALFHHESPDGSGYPYGLKLKEIPISARIVKVADVYDALLSDRHYKKSWKKDEVFTYLNSNQFDREIVSAFKSALKNYDREPAIIG
jgi:HD-GYP domain-containing protein (c-di-GMP phosphodiesterase class II)